MSLFYFHINDGVDLVPEAIDYANIEAAKEAALRVFGQMVRDQRDFSICEDLGVRVTDNSGLTLFQLGIVLTVAPAIDYTDRQL